jgi:hypothetical protein
MINVMNNMINLDHHNLVIYIDMGYPKSYHDVNIFYHITFIEIGYNILQTRMIILNTFWDIQATW